jgi:hypothetical protein
MDFCQGKGLSATISRANHSSQLIRGIKSLHRSHCLGVLSSHVSGVKPNYLTLLVSKPSYCNPDLYQWGDFLAPPCCNAQCYALAVSLPPVAARWYGHLQGSDARMQVSAQYTASLIFAVAVGYLAVPHKCSATCVEILDTATNRLGSRRCGLIGPHLSIQMSHHGLCLSARMQLDGKLSRLAKLGIAVVEIWLCLSHLPP